jgi:hypothetical protein
MSATTGLVLVVAGVMLLAVALGAVIASVAGRHHDDESGLGSDEEWVRELLGYQPSHYPMQQLQAWQNGGTDRPDKLAP